SSFHSYRYAKLVPTGWTSPTWSDSSIQISRRSSGGQLAEELRRCSSGNAWGGEVVTSAAKAVVWGKVSQRAARLEGAPFQRQIAVVRCRPAGALVFFMTRSQR